MVELHPSHGAIEAVCAFSPREEPFESNRVSVLLGNGVAIEMLSFDTLGACETLLPNREALGSGPHQTGDSSPFSSDTMVTSSLQEVHVCFDKRRFREIMTSFALLARKELGKQNLLADGWPA